ncbi:hypothetical protein K505DRAFT_363474 [Melanomma pulvis-pyrius CBS 109.77]|uniref:FAD/NAD(P)-binding domain-containing protein n=1 Tax=Melanomma pulvis-pyrius CBS 109.77 TaxID=1314802 RepID=A0A6A6X6S5_9PLEO|nr:hypothetical protein K505DRAFT_363474 [Melanomma pulvis-pyrius CBS 109.77]
MSSINEATRNPTTGPMKLLSKEVTTFTNGSKEVEAQLKTTTINSPFKIESRHIARLVDRISPLTYPQWELSQQSELKLSHTSDIHADAPAYERSSFGMFAVGDSISPFKIVSYAIASGNFAAVAAATQLQAEKYNHFSLV